jgi:hypothetical protein
MLCFRWQKRDIRIAHVTLHERLEVVHAYALRGEAKKASPCWIENLHSSFTIDNEKAGHQAVGDLPAQLIGRGGTSAHCLLLRLQFGHRFLQRSRENHRVRTVLTQVSLRVARAGNNPQERVGHHAHQHRDDSGQPDERITKLGHDARPAQVRYARSARS